MCILLSPQFKWHAILGRLCPASSTALDVFVMKELMASPWSSQWVGLGRFGRRHIGNTRASVEDLIRKFSAKCHGIEFVVGIFDQLCPCTFCIARPRMGFKILVNKLAKSPGVLVDTNWETFRGPAIFTFSWHDCALIIQVLHERYERAGFRILQYAYFQWCCTKSLRISWRRTSERWIRQFSSQAHKRRLGTSKLSNIIL